ncbi:MAG: hypothetical protein EOM54_10295 [Clostridia bacterium]|nr:hypothetical protein [Clostridia bacterium]
MFRKLRAKLKEEDIDQAYLAEKFDVCPVVISNRMTGKTDWRLKEMYLIMDIIGEPYSKLYTYFPKNGADIDNTKEISGAKSRPGDEEWICPFLKVVAVKKT